ncbi:phosphoenolpyruvate carboxylase [Povalibacter uvarum]|uniref:Phosphoenolpyruvate carboxylase n=1 Tax=Povalibacter uvarum TaxID=732238 RepID=A0A841HVN1_9GAMM|nr:phosphoenolpyruvate carboxylase [Povalibacter uvarum]MBB6096002.1 phosphoenolpyruvate carboxylase [Povalibacter uvarum]
MPRHDLVFPSKDADLREDVHMLGALVGDVIREQGGEELFQAVERARQAAIGQREGEAEGAVRLMVCTRGISPALSRDLVRAFSTWFEMVNMAEKVHRIRRRRHYMNEGETQPGGIEDALIALREKGLQLTDIRRLMLEMWIEPVFTAHPTESTRRTILRKQQKIAQLLLGRIGLSRSAAETQTIWERIRTDITSGWQTADNSRERLTVADEREHALFFIVEILFQIVPVFYEEVTAALVKVYGPEAKDLELPEILRFGSWVGGDMDGNPDVNAKTIRETIARHQQLIVNRYFLECQGLAESLSQSATRIGISPQLQARIDHYQTLLSESQSLSPARHDRMPYRVFLGQILERLRSTYEGRQAQYESASHFLADLNLIYDSLMANRGAHAGAFQVSRLIRRVRTFGFHLATLDIRQSSVVHRGVVGQGIGDSNWKERSAEDRVARLRHALERDESPCAILDATGKRALWVFEALAHCRHRNGPDSIGPYVVSSTRGVDDILSVLLLARWADTADRRSGDVPVDVAPLFESAEALSRCGELMRQLLNEPLYRRHLHGRGNHQYVMIGYSASNKDSGVAMSRWLVRKAQESLVEVAASSDVDLTFMHGQGGSFGRGGGRTEALIRSSPEGVSRGRLRITEAGELINEKYGLRPIALRIFEQAFNVLALASSGTTPREVVDPKWREIMDFLATQSANTYRATTYEDAAFNDFFRQLTPIDVIERMQIGSRPTTRNERTGIAALRSIPWNYAWSQCRYMMPGWFGVGSALTAAMERVSPAVLKEMYERWFFFQNLIDDIELALARADLSIAAFYDELVDPQYQRFIPVLREEYDLARKRVLELKGATCLLESEPTIQRSIRLRSPYIDPMHLLQVDLLKRWRAGGREDKEMLAALLSSITGISQALQGA